MKKKFRTALSDKTKDFGLSDKAIDELVELGVKGLSDDASDEDIAQAVDSIVPFAKAMQAETTRKTQKKPSAKQSSKKEGNEEGNEENDDEQNKMPEWAKQFQEKLNALETENATLKANAAKNERAALIAEKAKALGIPDYLMKRVSFAEDADIDKELGDYKQELVTNNLMPKASLDKGSQEEAMKADAKAWAESLPNL